jgi:hypothetical protein
MTSLILSAILDLEIFLMLLINKYIFWCYRRILQTGLLSKMANVTGLIKSPTFLAKILELVSRENCTDI